jgi:Eco29kI restriction endonuclease
VTKGKAYNPLDKINLAKSIETELLVSPTEPLSTTDHTAGAGVYVIYYTGPFAAYAPLAEANRGGQFTRPIYIGKAIPKGGRKGGLAKDVAVTGRALGDRLKQHATSIAEAQNLDLADFHVRHLVVDDIWIPLGENMLIETFEPVWNRAIDGFGNKDPGNRRATQYRSPWDVLHPGRQFAVKLANSPLSVEFLLKRIEDYFAGRPLDKLPKAIAKQQAEEEAEAEDAADEI